MADLRALLDKIEAVKGLAVDSRRTLGRTADKGRSVWIRASELELTATRERVDVNEFKPLILKGGGVCVEITLENVEFLDRPGPAEWNCLLRYPHIRTHTSIVARPVFS